MPVLFLTKPACLVGKIYVEIPRKYHNHEAEPSRSIVRRGHEEQIMKKKNKTLRIKPQTHEQDELQPKNLVGMKRAFKNTAGFVRT